MPTNVRRDLDDIELVLAGKQRRGERVWREDEACDGNARGQPALNGGHEEALARAITVRGDGCELRMGVHQDHGARGSDRALDGRVHDAGRQLDSDFAACGVVGAVDDVPVMNDETPYGFGRAYRASECERRALKGRVGQERGTEFFELGAGEGESIFQLRLRKRSWMTRTYVRSVSLTGFHGCTCQENQVSGCV